MDLEEKIQELERENMELKDQLQIIYMKFEDYKKSADRALYNASVRSIVRDEPFGHDDWWKDDY